ncbi:MAG: hypothetical protein ACLUNO_00640 [Oscillospiraceae bacterium]
MELQVDTTVNLTQLLQQGSIDAMCVIDDPLPQGQWHIWRQTEVPGGAGGQSGRRRWPAAAEVTPGGACRQRTDPDGEERTLQPSASRACWRSIKVACEPFLRLPSASAARELLLDGPFVSLLPWYTVRADVEAGRL